MKNNGTLNLHFLYVEDCIQRLFSKVFQTPLYVYLHNQSKFMQALEFI